jgi:hypothetical protein
MIKVTIDLIKKDCQFDNILSLDKIYNSCRINRFLSFIHFSSNKLHLSINISERYMILHKVIYEGDVIISMDLLWTIQIN